MWLDARGGGGGRWAPGSPAESRTCRKPYVLRFDFHPPMPTAPNSGGSNSYLVPGMFYCSFKYCSGVTLTVLLCRCCTCSSITFNPCGAFRGRTISGDHINSK